MDHLPHTLISLLNTVVEQYKKFSWTSYEENGKMKISMIWTNDEHKRAKSQATRKRDIKRFSKFMESKKNNYDEPQINSNKVESDLETDHSLDESENEMDINDNQTSTCRASSQVNLSLEKSIHKTIADKNVDIPIDDINKRQVNTVSERKRHLNDQDKQLYKCKQRFVNNSNTAVCLNGNNTKQIGSNGSNTVQVDKHDESKNCIVQEDTTISQCERTQEPKEITKRPWRCFKKVVIKTTSGFPDILIGKLPGKDFIVVHGISANTMDIFHPYEREFKYFNKNLEEDFKDIQETDYWNENTKIKIDMMERFVFKHKLHLREMKCV